MMPSRARVRESWATARTPAPTVTATTAAAAAAAGKTPYTAKAAYVVRYSTAIPPPWRLRPYTGRRLRRRQPKANSTRPNSAMAARIISTVIRMRPRSLASRINKPSPMSEIRTPTFTGTFPVRAHVLTALTNRVRGSAAAS